MECTSDGTIIRAKELNTNFTIPRKRKPPESPKDTIEDRAVQDSSVEPQSILNSDPQYNWTQNVYNHENVEQRKPGGLKRIHEEPKIHKTYKETFGDLSDGSLPKELREQFQPLFCKLCAAQLGSTVNAKLHYASKNHDKKVRKFLQDYSERTGEPLHKRAKEHRAKPSEDEEYNPKYFRCEACDLPLTGKIHAESHYMGKNHQKVVSGKKQPVGKGQYDENGQWKRSVVQTDVSGRNGFGQDFAALEKHPETAASLRCELCQVSVTSLPQMDMHLQGQRHQKKLKANGLQSPIESPQSSLPGFASYRTPSGQYYCKVCNVSMNAESQFMTHLQSKNHAKKQAAAAKD